MEIKKIKKHRTLQGKLIILLLLPVFLIIFSGGALSFLYTRTALINQWNESAVLKLQRAAHYIEMRLLKPVELIETLFQVSREKQIPLSLDEVAAYLETIEGVLAVGVRKDTGLQAPAAHNHGAMMAFGGMTQFRHTRILDVSQPVYDTDAGHNAVIMSVTLVDSAGSGNGRIEIKMSFNYLLKDIIQLGWWQSDMACIVDKAGKYMAHTNMTMKGRHYLGGENDPLEQAILQEMKTAVSGTVQSPGYPPAMVAGFYKLEQVPWTIILFAKGKNILQPITNYRNAFVFGSGVLIFLILLLIRQHVGQIVHQIKTLSKNARKIARGEYGEPVKANSNDEIGQLVEIYNDMVTGLKERDFIRDSFGRYVDPEFAKLLLRHPDAGNLGGQRREVVLMMSDIRGFTPLSETLSPEIIIRILNQYFSHMIKIIQDHDGIIVDFFGDSILVFFDPVTGTIEDKVFCAVQCASRMQSEMAAFNEKMRLQQMPGLDMGIGINAGQVVVGNIGSETRSKYGVVGSAVNITSRIQAKAQKKEILISESVYAYVRDQVDITKKFTAKLKGVEGLTTLRAIDTIYALGKRP
ncbi:adenylate/guanylate cyclase domain-containing protein [Desulfotignum balticum]|uniref:adenylate/guanylate cyclase domain-containing protein n=1 Tax=Desulfotignum balticum TaxID=115781 RepID=UPI0003FBE0C2|nr:adenylate/guanylate cyclase domain-containing protein [Desulfotignum balticum]